HGRGGRRSSSGVRPSPGGGRGGAPGSDARRPAPADGPSRPTPRRASGSAAPSSRPRCESGGSSSGSRRATGRRRRIAVCFGEGLQRLAGRFLLGVLLRGALADAGLDAVDERGGGERPLMGRPFRVDQGIADRTAAPGELLLHLRLLFDLV